MNENDYCRVTPKDLEKKEEAIARQDAAFIQHQMERNKRLPYVALDYEEEDIPLGEPDPIGQKKQRVSIVLPVEEWNRFLRTIADDTDPLDEIKKVIRVHTRQCELNEYKKELQAQAQEKLQKRMKKLDAELEW